jgi:hypothetical protein
LFLARKGSEEDQINGFRKAVRGLITHGRSKDNSTFQKIFVVSETEKAKTMDNSSVALIEKSEMDDRIV